MIQKVLLPALLFSLLTTACVPDDIKDQMSRQMAMAQKVMADQQFKNTLGQIELHKLRTGGYPASLSELKFLNAMDSSMLRSMEYSLLDSGYELNVKINSVKIEGVPQEEVSLKYPSGFWTGLGCVKSNCRNTENP